MHANGLSGKVDWRVRLTGPDGHPMRVIQGGPTVLVVDETTGEISRIDPSQLTVAQSRNYGAAGTPVVSDARTATAIVADASGGRLRVNLPSPMAQESALLAPSRTDGPLVPLADPAHGDLVVLDTRRQVWRRAAMNGPEWR